MRVPPLPDPQQDHSWDSFDAIRSRVAAEWAALPRTADVISGSLRALQARVREEHFSRDRLTSLHAAEVRLLCQHLMT